MTTEAEAGALKYLDIGGSQIYVGDYVVYPAKYADSSIIRFGIVTELKHRDGFWSDASKFPTLRIIAVERNYSGKWSILKEGKEITLGRLDHILRLPSFLGVPQAAVDILVPLFNRHGGKRG